MERQSDTISPFQEILESTLAIPWRLDWASKSFTYVGPQIERLLGWSVESWQNINDWASRIHVADRERVLQYCRSQSEAGIDHQAEYRALKADGSFVSVRDIVHVVRKENQVESLVGFILDLGVKKTSIVELGQLSKLGDNHFPTLTGYNFTPAETRLAEALLAGQKAAEYASNNCLSITTVRTQIRSILEKSNVRRQSDFILTLLHKGA